MSKPMNFHFWYIIIRLSSQGHRVKVKVISVWLHAGGLPLTERQSCLALYKYLTMLTSHFGFWMKLHQKCKLITLSMLFYTFYSKLLCCTVEQKCSTNFYY